MNKTLALFPGIDNFWETTKVVVFRFPGFRVPWN